MLVTAASVLNVLALESMPGLALIPAGKFEMGDHYGYLDEKHESHEVPIHPVYLDAYYIGIYDVTTREYCEFLNSALAQKSIEVRNGGVYLVGGQDLLCDTRAVVAIFADWLGRENISPCSIKRTITR